MERPLEGFDAWAQYAIPSPTRSTPGVVLVPLPLALRTIHQKGSKPPGSQSLSRLSSSRNRWSTWSLNCQAFCVFDARNPTPMSSHHCVRHLNYTCYLLYVSPVGSSGMIFPCPLLSLAKTCYKTCSWVHNLWHFCTATSDDSVYICPFRMFQTTSNTSSYIGTSYHFLHPSPSNPTITSPWTQP